MLNTSVARIICCHLFLLTEFAIIFSDSLPILGPADVTLNNVLQCENSEELPISFVLEKKKFNRTVEIINGVLTSNMDLDENVAININIARWGDGGYKPNFILMDDTNACHFVFKHLNKIIRKLLSAEGRPDSCPIMKGSLHLKNYIFDSRDLPDRLMYGKFRATITLIKNGEVVLCFLAFLESKMKSTFG